MKSRTYNLVFALAVLFLLPACEFIPSSADSESKTAQIDKPSLPLVTSAPSEGDPQDPMFGPGKDLMDANGCPVAKAALIAYGYLRVKGIQIGETTIDIDQVINITTFRSRLAELMRDPPPGEFSEMKIYVEEGSIMYSSGTNLPLEVPEGEDGTRKITISFDPPYNFEKEKSIPPFCLLTLIELVTIDEQDFAVLSPPSIFLHRASHEESH